MVDEAQARDARRARLTSYMFDLYEHIEKLEMWTARNDVSGYFSQMCKQQAGAEIDRVNKELRNIKLSISEIKGKVTDDMIQQAREVDVSTVVEFTRGKAIAFCHDDNNPSMFHAKRINKVSCPVCGLYFDSIGVLMGRDGLPFFTAVKQLIGGN